MIRRPLTAIGLAGVVLLGAYLTAMIVLAKPDGRVVFGDATHHFVQLRSLVYDRDLHFQNEYIRIYRLRGDEPGTEWIFKDLTTTGRVRNYMPIGPALLWAPLYLVLSALQLVASWAGLARPPDGYDRLLQMVPGIMGVIAATLAAIITWRTVRRTTGDESATVAVFGVWFGSHAIYYTLVSPSYSHATSMFAASLFFSAWIGGRDRVTLPRVAGWGALVGLMALMRWQDGVFGVIPLVEVMRWRASWSQRVGACLAAGAAFLVAFAPQMTVWTVLYRPAVRIAAGAVIHSVDPSTPVGRVVLGQSRPVLVGPAPAPRNRRPARCTLAPTCVASAARGRPPAVAVHQRRGRRLVGGRGIWSATFSVIVPAVRHRTGHLVGTS